MEVPQERSDVTRAAVVPGRCLGPSSARIRVVVYLHTLPFLPNALGDVMRPGTYYAIAGLLLAATVPMYVYMFRRARPVAVAAPAVVPVLRREGPRPVRLMPGEQCYAGVVFQVTGASAVQLFDAMGRPVPCVPTGIGRVGGG